VTIYFLDSSGLVKHCAVETGTRWISSIINPSAGNRLLIAQLTPGEVVSGLARKQREANISVRTLRAAMLLIERHVKRHYIVVQFASQVEEQAKRLLTAYPLRAYDAVQLASAWVSNQQLAAAGLSALTFVSADTRLLNAASSEGLLTDSPNHHP
jgi:predicted nucleic acid-binding protein